MKPENIKKDLLDHRSTYLIVLLTLAVWFAQLTTFSGQVSSGQALLESGAIFSPHILADPSQIWRLFTPIFVHASWGHVLSNMLIVFFMGRLIEEIFGHLRYLIIYLLAGIFANSAIFFLAPDVLSTGASGAVFGLFGAIAALGYFTGDPRLKQIGKTFAVLIILQIFINLFQLGQVNIWGHIGGALGGVLLAAFIPPKAYWKWVPTTYKVSCGLIFVALMIVFIALPFMRG
ncbi:rhomboid family intramembrane serine protease [Lactococcus termiticola]|uniref:Membrane-associated serine protease n=1 Tax=Lactococcus termiticola TaxID=2169526 RepID=A0A2R5HHL8_9LACT|nr:rhomboid family intramembrane serine protease [Lactococcus termiticola]GBG96845.1 membrane-associated serine protease [Lactococcus termiticola]